MKNAVHTVIGIGLAGLLGCQTPPPNRGQSGYWMDPTHDAPSELGSGTLRSSDLIEATDEMAMHIASRLDSVNRESPPRIYLGRIENRTSLPHQNFQIFLVRLRALLNSSGAHHGLEFIAERARVEQARARELGEAAAAGYSSRADYVLTCEVFDMPSDGTNYYLLDYQLVQLRKARSGPDIGAGAIVWENSYEVKFR